MPMKDFNSEKHARKLAEESKKYLPNDLIDDDKSYITKKVFEFSFIAVNHIIERFNDKFNNEQVETIAQFIGEWTFHKCIDIIRANIPTEHRAEILQQVAFAALQEAIKAFQEEQDKNKIAARIELQVAKAYETSINTLAQAGDIPEDKVSEILSQSNVDECAKKELNKEKQKEISNKILTEDEFLKKSCQKTKKSYKDCYKETEHNAKNLDFGLFKINLHEEIIFRIRKYSILILIGLLLLFLGNHFQMKISEKLLIEGSIFLIVVLLFKLFVVSVKKDMFDQYQELEEVKKQLQALVDPNKMYERIKTDDLTLVVGKNLLGICDPEQEGKVLAKLAALRQRITDKFGYIIPAVRVVDDLNLKKNEYQINLRELPIDKGIVYPDRLMVIADQWNSMGLPVPANVISDVDPTFKMPVFWIKPDQLPKDNISIEADDAIISHLQYLAIKHVDDIITFSDVQKLIDLVKEKSAVTVDLLNSTMVTPVEIRKILANLIREKISIKDIGYIFERLCDFARISKDPDNLSERIRTSLGRHICLENATPEKTLYVVTLSPEWEKILDESCQKTELGTMFQLNPEQVQELMNFSGSILMSSHKNIGSQPAILCNPKIRLPLYQLLERHIPTVVVISYSEIVPDVKVIEVGIIGNLNPMQQNCNNV